MFDQVGLTYDRAGPKDAADITAAGTDLFDGPVLPSSLNAFLEDPRHHLILARDEGTLVGFVSAMDHVHPDKPRDLWINEIGVVETHRRRGIARGLMAAVFELGRQLQCQTAWVLADPTTEALGLYTALGGAREGDHIAMFSWGLQDGR